MGIAFFPQFLIEGDDPDLDQAIDEIATDWQLASFASHSDWHMCIADALADAVFDCLAEELQYSGFSKGDT